MDKLRTTIEQYTRWKALDIYIDRMEAHLETDFSHSVENAKALLETIGKEICNAKGVDIAITSSINGVLKKAFTVLGYSGDELVASVSGSLANIGQQVGNLRNDISPTSHGKSLDELRERNNKVDILTREFLIDSTLVVAVFLIRTFEERKDIDVKEMIPSEEGERVSYDDAEDFNESWDQSFGEFQMGEYSFVASEILYGLDYQAYATEYKLFGDTEAELEEGEEQ